jgi:hypothetical protein
VLLNAIVTAIAYKENNGTAEVFDGDAEAYEVIVQVVNTVRIQESGVRIQNGISIAY